MVCAASVGRFYFRFWGFGGRAIRRGCAGWRGSDFRAPALLCCTLPAVLGFGSSIVGGCCGGVLGFSAVAALALAGVLAFGYDGGRGSLCLPVLRYDARRLVVCWGFVFPDGCGVALVVFSPSGGLFWAVCSGWLGVALFSL